MGSFLAAAIAAKKVPVSVVSERDKADFDITGTSKSDKRIIHNGRIERIWRGKTKREAAVYLENYRQLQLRDGAEESAVSLDRPF
jgi:hypothetical protein